MGFNSDFKGLTSSLRIRVSFEWDFLFTFPDSSYYVLWVLHDSPIFDPGLPESTD